MLILKEFCDFQSAECIFVGTIIRLSQMSKYSYVKILCDTYPDQNKPPALRLMIHLQTPPEHLRKHEITRNQSLEPGWINVAESLKANYCPSNHYKVVFLCDKSNMILPKMISRVHWVRTEITMHTQTITQLHLAFNVNCMLGFDCMLAKNTSRLCLCVNSWWKCCGELAHRGLSAIKNVMSHDG